jgi:Uma2 family endonuclease
MADLARRRATYEDVLAAPPHKVAEVIDGELYLNPRPGGPHARSGVKLIAKLDGPFDSGEGGPGGWILLAEPELHIGPDVLVPDLAAWRRERMATVPNAPYFTLAPDWICEVLSKSTARTDRWKKLPIYARERVKHAWLVDPILRTLEVFRLSEGRWTLVATYGENDRVRAEPFDAIELELGVLWADVERDPEVG